VYRAYDRAAVMFRGVDADINFNLSDYEDDLKQVKTLMTMIKKFVWISIFVWINSLSSKFNWNVDERFEQGRICPKTS